MTLGTLPRMFRHTGSPLGEWTQLVRRSSGATAPRSPLRLKQLKRLGSNPDAKVVFPLINHMKRKNFRQEGQGEEKTRRAAQRKKEGANVRTARQKVCRLLCDALGAVRVRTGVGTPFPLRLLAQILLPEPRSNS